MATKLKTTKRVASKPSTRPRTASKNTVAAAVRRNQSKTVIAAAVRRNRSTPMKRRNIQQAGPCGKGTVAIGGTCVPAELAFQMTQTMSQNPINNYAEIQGMLASKTILDDPRNLGADFNAINANWGHIQSGPLLARVDTSKLIGNVVSPQCEWLWSR